MANVADLAGFLEAADHSLADAQESLASDAPQIASMVSEAELEVLQRAQAGDLIVEPVAVGRPCREARPGAPSTFRVRYVAVAEEPAAALGGRAVKTAKAVIDEIRARRDVAALDKILGGLKIEAEFAPATRRWVVTARIQWVASFANSSWRIWMDSG